MKKKRWSKKVQEAESNIIKRLEEFEKKIIEVQGDKNVNKSC
jgi:hypothetical protein